METASSTDHRKPPTSRRPRDLALSLLVLLVPILVLVGGYQLLAGRTQPVAVDPAPEIAAAQQAGFEVAEPTGLDPAWVPVSAVFRTDEWGDTLRIGFVTPDGAAVQVVQSSVPPPRLLAAELADGVEAHGSVDVDGTTWQAYPGRPGERALVLQEPHRTVLVVGTAAEPELRVLAASLR